MVTGTKTLRRRALKRTRWPFKGFTQRAIARSVAIYRLPHTGIRWTREFQAWAVSEGFFVERANWDNMEAVNLIPLVNLARNPLLNLNGNRAFARQTMRRIQRGEFTQDEVLSVIEAGAFGRDPDYERCREFIKQQDQFGHSFAWEPVIEIYSPHLKWYQNMFRGYSLPHMKPEYRRELIRRKGNNIPTSNWFLGDRSDFHNT
jgi:hypothetical protein